MICSLGSFVFEVGGVDVTNIKRSRTYTFSKQDVLSDFAKWQSSGKYAQSISMGGKLIQKKQGALDGLVEIAEKKLPVTLAFEDGRATTVVITEIEQDHAKFLGGGAFLQQDFEVKLEVVHGQV